MFTGLIQQKGRIKDIKIEGSNKTFVIQPQNLWTDIQVDESISHNGICLTVVAHHETTYEVTAIHETLQLTTAQNWQIGDVLNLERAMRANDHLGGHFVQGHVDGIAECIRLEDKLGSTEITFKIPQQFAALIVEKGSITIDGISLTIFNLTLNTFKVAIIPYTWENTNLQHIHVGKKVNVEFDIIGKYLQRASEIIQKSVSNL